MTLVLVMHCLKSGKMVELVILYLKCNFTPVHELFLLKLSITAILVMHSLKLGMTTTEFGITYDISPEIVYDSRTCYDLPEISRGRFIT